MPYVNKLNVRGTQFDIRDEEARTEIEALKKKIAQLDNPNSRFELKYTGIVLASDTDVTNFTDTYNSTNNYGDLAVGNIITIQDGTYNKDWVVAGFDMYKLPTVIENAISLLPLEPVTTTVINEISDDGTYDAISQNLYGGSKLHNETLKTIADNLTANMPDLLYPLPNLYSSMGDKTRQNLLTVGFSIGNDSSTSDQYYIRLMSEVQINGNRTFSNTFDSGYNHTQFPLFRHVILPMLPYYIRYYCKNNINNLENLPVYKNDVNHFPMLLGDKRILLRDVVFANAEEGFLTWDFTNPNDNDTLVFGSGGEVFDLYPEIAIASRSQYVY